MLFLPVLSLHSVSWNCVLTLFSVVKNYFWIPAGVLSVLYACSQQRQLIVYLDSFLCLVTGCISTCECHCKAEPRLKHPWLASEIIVWKRKLKKKTVYIYMYCIKMYLQRVLGFLLSCAFLVLLAMTSRLLCCYSVLNKSTCKYFFIFHLCSCPMTTQTQNI